MDPICKLSPQVAPFAGPTLTYLTWCYKADLLDDPADVFAYLYRTRIGEDLALFYLAWALVAEKAGKFAFADSVYGKGLARYETSVVHATDALI